MNRRHAVQVVTLSLAVAAGCSGDHPAGPAAPTCSDALATTLNLAPARMRHSTPDPTGGA